jgi:uncharacterized spore protein YtfJ
MPGDASESAEGSGAPCQRQGDVPMTTVPELARSLGDRVRAGANPRTVYGDPVTVDGRTVIPVARVDYGVAAGGGEDSAAKAGRRGVGGAGGVHAVPVGALEITDQRTRFIRFIDPVRWGIALAVATIIGFALGRRSRR